MTSSRLGGGGGAGGAGGGGGAGGAASHVEGPSFPTSNWGLAKVVELGAFRRRVEPLFSGNAGGPVGRFKLL